MPKIMIDLPDEVNKKLKKYALDNGRSLTQFLPRYISACVAQSVITFDENCDFVIVKATTRSQQRPGIASNPSDEIRRSDLTTIG